MLFRRLGKDQNSTKSPGVLGWTLLRFLVQSPRHGYDLIRSCREAGIKNAHASTIYPELENLVLLGFVRVTIEGRRKIHSVTAQGRKYLESVNPSLEHLYPIEHTLNTERVPEAIRALLKTLDGLPPTLSPDQINTVCWTLSETDRVLRGAIGAARLSRL